MKETLKHIAPTLHRLKGKKKPFQVPNGYFENLESTVFDKLNKKSFVVPEKYFEKIEEHVFAKINNEKKAKKFKVLTLSNYTKYLITSIAAAIIIYFSLIKQDEISLNEDSIIAYLELEEELLSTYDIASVLDDDTLETINLNNIDISTIETYLEDNLDVLDL
jgi:hypothetical protein